MPSQWLPIIKEKRKESSAEGIRLLCVAYSEIFSLLLTNSQCATRFNRFSYPPLALV